MNVTGPRLDLHLRAAAQGSAKGAATVSGTSTQRLSGTASVESGNATLQGVKQKIGNFLKSVGGAIREGVRGFTHQSERAEAAEQRITTPLEVAERSVKLQAAKQDASGREEAAEKMERLESILSLVTAGTELMESVMTIGSDITKWNELSEKSEKLGEKISHAKAALIQAHPGEAYTVDGNTLSAENAINTVLKKSQTASSMRDIETVLSNSTLPSDIQSGLKTLIEAQVKLKAVNTQLQTHQVKTVGTHGATAATVTKSALTGVKTFAKHLGAKAVHGVASAGAGIGLAVSVIKFGFDARALTRAVKSFSRASASNPHLSKLMKSDKLSKDQKMQLSRLSQNIRRIGQKKVVDKSLTTIASAAGTVAGIVFIAVAVSNPIGAGIALAGGLITLGVVVHSMVRHSRHAQKVATGRAKVQSFQQFSQKGIESLKQKIATNPSQKAALYKQFGIQNDAHLETLTQLSAKKDLALGYSLSGSSANDPNLNAMEKLAQSVRPKMEEALVNLTYQQFQRDLTSTQLTQPSNTIIQQFKAEKKGFLGKLKSLFRSDEKLFMSLKKEMAANMVSTASDVHATMHDLQTRDEMAVDTQFRDVMSSLSKSGDTTAEQDALVRYYSDISTSQGKELENRTFLTAPEHEVEEQTSSFARLMDLGE